MACAGSSACNWNPSRSSSLPESRRTAPCARCFCAFGGSDFSRDAFGKAVARAFDRLRRSSHKREGHPAWRLPPIHGRQVREAEPGFSSGLPPAARPCRPRLTAAQGPRVEQRAILARTRDGARTKAKAEAEAKLLASAVLLERRPKAKVEGQLVFTLRLRRCAATLRAIGR